MNSVIFQRILGIVVFDHLDGRMAGRFDDASRYAYYSALEQAQSALNIKPFYERIAPYL